MRVKSLVLNQSVQGLIVNAASARELHQRKLFASVTNVDVRSGVRPLFLRRGPTHVTWFVVAVDDDPIQRMPSRRPLSHMSKESRKVVAPFLAHRDASRAVGRKLMVGGREASALGVQPRFVFRRALVTSGSAVGDAPRANQFRSQAAAATGAARAQRIGPDGDDLSAIAKADPGGASAEHCRRSDKQPAETLPRQSKFSHVHSIANSVVHTGPN
jgi:hypothetical protein